MAPQPVRGLLWLLRQVSSRDAANAAVGDLLDELRGANRPRVRRAPRLWVNGQALKVASSFAASMMPRLWRSGGHMLRDAVRSLRRSPAYTTLVIVLLAVGIAAGTITFSVVDAVVLRPLALEEGDRLVSVPTRDDTYQERISPDTFRRVRDEATGFESVAALSMLSGGTVTVDGVADDLEVMYSTSDLFRVLRFVLMLGRSDRRGRGPRRETDVAVLGYRFWMQRFHGDPTVLGRTVLSVRHPSGSLAHAAAETDIPDLAYSRCAVWASNGSRQPGRTYHSA
jgi:hypothetical protein